MQTNEIQELLLDTIPAWHYWFARPFKRMLNDGVSLDMYYCIQSMRRSGRTMTMTELANFARMPKQQMSKLVDKLVEGGFAERLSDPDDRRVIRLRFILLPAALPVFRAAASVIPAPRLMLPKEYRLPRR